MSQFIEVQCDGLVGPTHNYAGLSHGNIASQTHAQSVAQPKRAALEGLEKMKIVAELGIPQLVIPPQKRPNFSLLRALGFNGSDAEMIQKAAKEAPALLAAAWSASSMWVANMATVSPAPDTGGTLHLTPANLISTLHRHQEAWPSYHVLQQIFGRIAVIHPPLPACIALADEGAANHMRLAANHGEPGVEIFVYGRDQSTASRPQKFPERQTRRACEAIARNHALPAERCVFVQQNPAAIDAGVFHNDVIAMSNQNLLIYHEQAFLEEKAFLEEVRRKLAPSPLIAIRVAKKQLSLEEAVGSYFFNSQLLSLPSGGMVVLAPSECEQIPSAAKLFKAMCDDAKNPIREVRYLNVRQSMQNGGGPACLRLRVAMQGGDLSKLPQGIIFTESLYKTLKNLISSHYPDQLAPVDLTNPALTEKAIEIHEKIFSLLGIDPPSPEAHMFQ